MKMNVSLRMFALVMSLPLLSFCASTKNRDPASVPKTTSLSGDRGKANTKDMSHNDSGAAQKKNEKREESKDDASKEKDPKQPKAKKDASGDGDKNQANDKGSRVQVTIKGFRNQKGQALVSLFSSKKGFPSEGEKSLKRVKKKIAKNQLTVKFEGLEPGTYAVAVLHDEDMDFQMKTSTFGIPKEGYGVSQDVKTRFGPPKYKDASFEVKAESQVDITINLRYL